MIETAIEALVVLGLIALAATLATRAYRNPHGAYLRILAWMSGAMGASFVLVLVVSAFSNSAAGLGLAFILAGMVAAIAVIAGLAVVAATAGHIFARRR